MGTSVVNEESVLALVRPSVAELNPSSTCCSRFQIHFTTSTVRNSHFKLQSSSVNNLYRGLSE